MAGQLGGLDSDLPAHHGLRRLVLSALTEPELHQIATLASSRDGPQYVPGLTRSPLPGQEDAEPIE
jgi:hypothetical protein